MTTNKPVETTDEDARSTGGAGWSGPILERSQKILDSLETPNAPPVPFSKGFAWPETGARGGSPNHECGAWTGEAVRAVTSGTRAEQDRAFAVLLNQYFPRELGPGKKAIGLRVSEQFAPDNHTHQHDQGVAMARVAAFLAAKAGHPMASELMRRSGELLRVTVSAFQALATPPPYYYISSAGMRAPGKPVWWWGTAFLRQVMGQPGPMPGFEPKPNKPDLWHDRAAVAVRAIRYLQNAGDDLGGAADVGPAGCRVKFEVLVYRGPSSHLVIMPRPKALAKTAAKGICDWVRVPWGIKSYEATMAQVEFGSNWETPPPKPPAGAELIRFQAMWG